MTHPAFSLWTPGESDPPCPVAPRPNPSPETPAEPETRPDVPLGALIAQASAWLHDVAARGHGPMPEE